MSFQAPTNDLGLSATSKNSSSNAQKSRSALMRVRYTDPKRTSLQLGNQDYAKECTGAMVVARSLQWRQLFPGLQVVVQEVHVCSLRLPAVVVECE